MGRLHIVARSTKQLKVAILIASSLLQWDNMIHLVIHANQSTASACVIVSAHDPLPRVHP
jgi:hypothetical protein